MAINITQLAYTAYQNRHSLKKLFKWLCVLVCIFVFLLYLIVATAFAVIQGNGGVADNGVNPNLAEFSEFNSFSYKTIYGDTWYEFKHPYSFPTLGSLTQGVILDSSAKVGLKHIAWDIADHEPRRTEVKAFADGVIVAINTNTLFNTTRRWKFCDEEAGGICWYEVKQKADIQFACGNEIIIQHTDSLRSQYCHLESFASLKVGDSVVVGQTIGYQGSTGWATGKHLHFALWRDGQPIDPSYAFLQTSLSDWTNN